MKRIHENRREFLSFARKDSSFRSLLIWKLASDEAHFLQFMKEMGDKPFTNPDTGNKVKLKSLKGPKGKKLVKSEFEKWLKGKEEGVKKEKPSQPRLLSSLEVERWATDHIEPLRKKWSEDQINAVLDYTGGGFESINKSLRFGNSDPKSEKTIQEMDSLFASPQGKLPTSAKSIRGVSKNHALVKLLESGELKPGCTFEDKGYQSTTMRSNVSGLFGSFHLNIEVPKGTEAIYVGPSSDRDRQYAKIAGEYELLLNRGTKLEVVSFDADSRSINVRVVSKK